MKTFMCAASAALAFAAAVSICVAQAAPTTINYQGRLTDNTPQQNPVTGTVAMRFVIFDSEMGGMPLWQEPPSGTIGVPVTGGIFQVVLGNNGTPLDSSVFAGGTSRWLEVVVNGETLQPRQRISSVPFALQSEKAQSAASAATAAVAGDAAQLGGAAPGSWQKALSPSACAPGQVLTAISQGGAATCVTPPPDGQWTSSGNDLISGLPGNVGIGTTPASKLDVAGVVTSDAVLQIGLGAPTIYDVTTQRYIVEAGPSVIGRVVPIDAALVDSLCRDKDGCLVTMSMVNWDPISHPGEASTREERLFISETSRWWRFATVDIEGLDANAAVNDYSIYDCFLTDGETYTGTSNGRADNGAGFGLLNVAGGSYNDSTTICRVVFHD